ncbi:MAG: hypothetical protein FWH04_04460 [Oscillospiraceae bacterium]|nr:hypothetical protein [Oscillospiraceae bacterium]
MNTAVTLGDRIKKQDPEAFELLQNVIGRPGMYVGEIRFDYIGHLFTGYYMGKGENCKLNFLPNLELQHWLLHTQSATLDTLSLDGYTLFNRYFGAGKMAFEKYKEFLNVPMPQISQGVNSKLHDYCKKKNIICWDDEVPDVPSSYYLNLATEVLGIAKEMIGRVGLTYDKLRIYIRKERLYNNIRFMLYGKNGWSDDREIIAIPENHELLIEMHAKARVADAKTLRECGYDVVDAQNWCEFSSDDMYTEYLRWKECITAS